MLQEAQEQVDTPPVDLTDDMQWDNIDSLWAERERILELIDELKAWLERLTTYAVDTSTNGIDWDTAAAGGLVGSGLVVVALLATSGWHRLDIWRSKRKESVEKVEG